MIDISNKYFTFALLLKSQFKKMLVTDQALKDVVFFPIDQVIRKMHKYSIREFQKNGFDITIDQWLVLKSVSDGDGLISQSEIAEILHKDNASLTRIIDILVKKSYLFRQMSATDRRRFDLIMTKEGIDLIKKMLPIVVAIRQQALQNVNQAELLVLQNVLEKIGKNLM